MASPAAHLWLELWWLICCARLSAARQPTILTLALRASTPVPRCACPASSSVKVFGTLSVDYPSLSSSELGDDDIYCNIPILACLRYSIPILLLITTYGYALLP